ALDAPGSARGSGGGARPAGTARHRRCGGSLIDVEICSHVVTLGERRLALVTVHDVTERERVERERRDAEAYRQKMERTGRMAGGLAHESNKVLAVLLGHDELLRQILPDASRAHTYC